VHPARLVVKRQSVPQDGIMVRDGGVITIFTWTYSQPRPTTSCGTRIWAIWGQVFPMPSAHRLRRQQQARDVAQSAIPRVLVHISELETCRAQEPSVICVISCDYAWGLEVGVYRRTFGPQSPETEAHWSKSLRFDKIAEGFGRIWEYVEVKKISRGHSRVPWPAASRRHSSARR